MSVNVVERKTMLRRVLPVAVIGISIAVLVSLFVMVTQRLNDLREAPGDNLTWSLSQTEVDLLRLIEETISSQQEGRENFKELRRRFDNFHSRVTSIAQSPVFRTMRADATFSGQLDQLLRCLDFTTPLIDVPDDELKDNLEFILLGFNGVRSDVHNIALTGIALRSQSADFERAQFSRLLLFAAIVSAALILFLIFMLFFLLRQYRLHRNTAAAVERANTRLSSTFQVSTDAIVVADDQGVILDFNQSAEQVFGYTRAEAIGAQMAELIIPHQYREAHYAGMERFNRTKEPRLVGQGRIEITALRKSGEEFPVEISIGQASDHRGAIFISYLRDITERLAAEQDLKQARDDALQAERAKSNFLAVMSHEMRTPLNGLFGTMELLKKTKLTKSQEGYVDVAQRSGDILLHHVNDVLDVSRLDAGKLELTEEVFDLEKFFADVVTTNEATAFAKDNKIILNLNDMPDSHVLADEHRLRQVAFNLVSNALKFTTDGTVTVEAVVKQDNDTHTLDFSVTDTGVGISEEDQSRVFERFFTQEKSYDRLASGAGLGLTICKQIVEIMGGTIGLQSTLGKGTTFHVTVPIKLAQKVLPEQQDAVSAIGNHTLQGKHVLLVEDNEINRMIVREMLQSEGITISEAHNGQRAVDMAAGEPFAAILMDISMPVMNGVDAAESIRSKTNPNRKTPIIALTAHALAEEQARFLAAGMNMCLDKPVSQTALIQALVSVTTPDQTAQHQPIEINQLDTVAFGELKSILPKEKIDKLVSGFEVEVNDLIASFVTHLNVDGLPELAKASHKSVGSAGMIGLLPFRDALRTLEQAAKAGDLQSAMDAAKAIETSWPNTLTTLKAAI